MFALDQWLIKNIDERSTQCSSVVECLTQWLSAWLKIEGLQVWASPEALHCVLEQDALSSA